MLPKTPTDWRLANAYFHSVFDTSRITEDLDIFVENAQDTIYNYFKDTHGTVKNDLSRFHQKYQNQSVKSLKRSLTQLNSNNAEIEEIKFVSKLIRSKLDKRVPEDVNINITEKLKTKFWSTCHDLFNKATNSIPTFTINICETYFRRIVTCIHASRFIIPRWIPKLDPPRIEYDDVPPTYKEIATAVNRCRASASPCPIDNLSVIILKRCPILRTLLHLIIMECWKQRRIPRCWKRSATILIYKKGDTSDPANFRPITLQPVFYKILAIVMKKRMYEFLSNNHYLDKTRQKGFWPKVDGVGEHTETLTRIMNDAKRHQRSLVISLLDLRNAFGEVQHNLIRAAIRYHHLPNLFSELFDAIYVGSKITVASNDE
jgi:hypothetical protein